MTTSIEPQQESFAERSESALCRSCGTRGLTPVLDLGAMPLVADFVAEHNLGKPIERFPLEMVFCPKCALVQIIETVPAEKLFTSEYPYYSSFADAWLEHAKQLADDTIRGRTLGPDSFVIELASNDGYLLKNFVERGIPVLGIDPAECVARAAAKVHVPTVCRFFSESLANEFHENGKDADVIFALNVLAHSTATNDFVSGVHHLLKEDGVFIVEAPYVVDLIDRLEFDTVYHEHLCYFSATAVDHLFRRNGLSLNHVEHVPTHGGSLRYVGGLHEEPDDSVTSILATEHQIGADDAGYYAEFASKVEQFRTEARDMILGLHAEGRRIAAYGAAAKGTIMLNYLGIDSSVVEFAVDRNVHKQGKYMPGLDIPVLAPPELLRLMPDYTLILPWNFKDEIMSQQEEYRRRGGRFIVPIPQLEIV